MMFTYLIQQSAQKIGRPTDIKYTLGRQTFMQSAYTHQMHRPTDIYVVRLYPLDAFADRDLCSPPLPTGCIGRQRFMQSAYTHWMHRPTDIYVVRLYHLDALAMRFMQSAQTLQIHRPAAVSCSHGFSVQEAGQGDSSNIYPRVNKYSDQWYFSGLTPPPPPTNRGLVE